LYADCFVICNHTLDFCFNLDGPTQPITGRCSIDEATCRNGRCIPRSYLYDGKDDCGDNSDEAGRKFFFSI